MFLFKFTYIDWKHASCWHEMSALGPSAFVGEQLPLIFVELPFYNTYTSYVVDNFIFGINLPDYPCLTIETMFQDNSN